MISVHIPEALSEIEDDIQNKAQQLAWWIDKMNRSRKNSLRSMRSMQVDICREQLLQLEQAKFDAEDKVADEARCDG